MQTVGFAALACACVGIGLMGWRRWQARFVFSAGMLSILSMAYGLDYLRLERQVSGRLALEKSVTEGGPKLSRDDEYVSSGKCQACHPSEYASWHRTYHRTMTQLALPENVHSDFADTTVNSKGIEYRVWREGDKFWAEMPDPDYMMLAVQGGKDVPLESIRRVKRQVVMVTGSHHYQTFWVRSSRFKTVLQTLPLVHLPDEDQWIPREDAFLQPPDSGRMITQWNTHCIKCHSTGGVPGVQGPHTVRTEVGELGISCEACHGPAARHVAANQSPLRRYGLHVSGASDPTITNPAKLDNKKSSEVCGQCHGLYTAASTEAGLRFSRKGSSFRPGGDILAERYYINFPTAESSDAEWENFHQNREFYKNSWWDDGTILVGGREYSALESVPCYTNGDMSCLSCHSMHHSKPEDQLKPGMRGSAACVQCHDSPTYTTNVAAHSHHAPDSSGSNCLNCHMPHTTYALFSGVRNHTISSPSIASSVQSATPNACNLCHLDRTLEWTQSRLAEWYDHDEFPLDEEQRTVAASLLWLIRGNAAQRVVVAWHFGWRDAQQASGTAWAPPFLAQTLTDPYGAVRHVAYDSLRSMPGFESIPFDFLGDTEQQSKAAAAARDIWRSTRFEVDASRRGALLLEDSRKVDESLFEQLRANRDNSPVRIAE